VQGCDGKPAPKPVFEEELGEKLIRYWHCPSKFIPSNIYTWYRIYQYHIKFPGAKMKSITKQNPRFLKALFYFEDHLNEYTSKIEKAKYGR